MKKNIEAQHRLGLGVDYEGYGLFFFPQSLSRTKTQGCAILLYQTFTAFGTMAVPVPLAQTRFVTESIDGRGGTGTWSAAVR